MLVRGCGTAVGTELRAVWDTDNSSDGLAPATINKRGRQIAPDDRRRLHAPEAAEQQSAKTLRGRIPNRVDVTERDELAIGRQGIQRRVEYPVLRRRQHVPPRQAADDAIGLSAAEMARQILRRVVNHPATRKTASQQLNVRGADFEREQTSALVQSLQQRLRKRSGARPKLDHGAIRFEIATLHNRLSERR